MAEEKNQDLDKVIDEIASQGKDTDSQLAELAKGLKDGFKELAEMFKGKKKDEEEEADDKGKKKDEEEEADDKAGEGAGYPDMRKAASDLTIAVESGDADAIEAAELAMRKATGAEVEAGDDYIDAGPILQSIQAENTALRKAVQGLESQMGVINDVLRAISTEALPSMAKASLHNASQFKALLDQPADVVDHAARGRAGRKRHADAAPPTVVEGIDKVKMSKARMKGLISEHEARYLSQNGSLPGDDDNKRLDEIRSL